MILTLTENEVEIMMRYFPWSGAFVKFKIEREKGESGCEQTGEEDIGKAGANGQIESGFYGQEEFAADSKSTAADARG